MSCWTGSEQAASRSTTVATGWVGTQAARVRSAMEVGRSSRGDPGGRRSGGGRSAVQVALWSVAGRTTATDRTLDVRRPSRWRCGTLRKLVRARGAWQLDLDGTIRTVPARMPAKSSSWRNGPSARTRSIVVLLMDAGGLDGASPRPREQAVLGCVPAPRRIQDLHGRTPSTTACMAGCTRTSQQLVTEFRRRRSSPILSPHHRVIFVGDASMAPYELFSVRSAYPGGDRCALEWHRLAANDFKARGPVVRVVEPRSTAVLEPSHGRRPSGRVFPMYELTLDPGFEGCHQASCGRPV